jgi:HAD superfamily hydrolase (TIGR01549 family)
VLFDLDGTLIETDDALVESLSHRLQFLRPLVPGGDTRALARRLVMWSEGPTNYGIAMLDRLGLDGPLLGLTDRLRRLKGIGTRDRFRLVDGTRELLRYLDGKYQLAVVTTRARREAYAFVEKSGLSPFFETVTTRQDTWRLKPHPAPVWRTADLLRVSPPHCLLVGDMSTDMRAAKRAGAQAVGVLSGFGDERELRAAGADLIVESVIRLREWL